MKTTNNINKKQIFSLAFNSALILIEIIGLIILFTIATPLWGRIDPRDGRLFKYFTTDSNFLLLISSINILVFQCLVFTKKTKQIPEWAKVIQLVVTSSVTLTMLAVLTFTPALAANGLQPYLLYTNSNLFFHLIAPVFAIITFLMFDERIKFTWHNAFYCLIPIILYSIFYAVVVFTHLQSGGIIDRQYDWYGLVEFGINLFPLFFVLAIGCSFLFGWLLWLGNRKIVIKGLEEPFVVHYDKTKPSNTKKANKSNKKKTQK